MSESSGRDGGRSHGINNTARYSGLDRDSRGIKNTAGRSLQGGSFKPGDTTGQTGSWLSSMFGNILPSDGRGSIKTPSTPYEGSVRNSGLSRGGTSIGQFPSSDSEKLNGHLGSNLPSDTLTVKGIPGDCSAREASHIFRVFRGWKGLKLYQTSTGPPGTLDSTVTFENATCAQGASKVLKGYAFDLNKPYDYRLSVEFGPSPHTPRHSVSHASR